MQAPLRLALFDMDDVVYVYRRADRVARLAALTGLDPAFIEERVWGEGLEYAADGGAYPTPETYIAGWRERLGHPLTIDQWVEGRKAGMSLIPGTLALIDELIAAGVAIAVLTNNGPLIHLHRFDLVPDLAARAGDRFLVSSAFGTQKPDPVIFTRALERLGFAPEETFFTDDKPENVEGALAAGLSGHTFVDPAGLAAALAARRRLSRVA